MVDLINQLQNPNEDLTNSLRRNIAIGDLELNSRQLVLFGLVVTMVTIALPYFVIGPYYTGLATTIMIYIGLAGGFNIIAGYTGQLSLGHAVFFGSGAYVAVLMWKAGYTFWLSLLTALVVSVAIAVVIGSITLRLRGLYFAFGMLAISEAMRLYLSQMQAVNGAAGLNIATAPPFSSTGFYLLSFTLVFLLSVTTYILKHSIVGLRLQAIRDDETKAEAQGINVWMYKNFAFILSAIFPAAAGVIYAFNFGHIGPSLLGVDVNINMQLMAILGGLGTLFGPILGGGLYYSMILYFSASFPNFQSLLSGILLIVLILYLPNGIVGKIFTEVWPDK